MSADVLQHFSALCHVESHVVVYPGSAVRQGEDVPRHEVSVPLGIPATGQPAVVERWLGGTPGGAAGLVLSYIATNDYNYWLENICLLHHQG